MTAFSDQCLQDNPILGYQFEETTGTTATDSSGNGNHATIVNASVNQTGLVGKGYLFNGTSDHLTTLSVSRPAGSLAVEFVGNFLSAKQHNLIVAQGHIGHPPRARVNADGTSRLYLGAPGQIDFSYQIPLNATFVHLVWELDVQQGVARLYKDGQLVQSVNTSLVAEVKSNELYIGADYGLNNRYHGIMDELWLYGAPLRLSRVQSHYNAIGAVAPGISAPSGFAAEALDSSRNKVRWDVQPEAYKYEIEANGSSLIVISVSEPPPKDPDQPPAPPPPPPPSGGYVSMLVSNDELTMWRDRRNNGPFRIVGDVASNSPGDWTAMNKAMSANFSSFRYNGPSFNADGSVNISSRVSNTHKNGSLTIMAAAYAALITENTTVAKSLQNEFIAQASVSNLDFSNRTKYPFGQVGDNGYMYNFAGWLEKLIRGWAIVKSMGYTSSRVDKWFNDFGYLCREALNRNLSSVFPNRHQNSYSSRSSFVNNANDIARWRTSGGTLIWQPKIARYYNNRRQHQAAMCGLAGVLTNDNTLIQEYKVFMREWVMFGHRVTDGMFPDYDRGTDDIPQLGYNYSVSAAAGIMHAADALARKGDTYVYDFETSDGAGNGGTNTGKRSFEDVIDKCYMNWIRRSWNFYTGGSIGANAPSYVAGNAYYRIQTRRTTSGDTRETLSDGHLLHPACYFKRTDWQSLIYRTAGHAFGYTNPGANVGGITGDHREAYYDRFLRSTTVNPYPA